MSSSDAPRPDGRSPARMSRALRREAVTKPDGRYLIYYSWPENRDEETRSGDEAVPSRPETRDV